MKRESVKENKKKEETKEAIGYHLSASGFDYKCWRKWMKLKHSLIHTNLILHAYANIRAHANQFIVFRMILCTVERIFNWILEVVKQNTTYHEDEHSLSLEICVVCRTQVKLYTIFRVVVLFLMLLIRLSVFL